MLPATKLLSTCLPLLVLALVACSDGAPTQAPVVNAAREATPTLTPKPTSTPQIFLMPKRPASPTPVSKVPEPTATLAPTAAPKIEVSAQFNVVLPIVETPSATLEPTQVEISGPKIEIACIFYDGLEPRTEGDEYVEITNRGDVAQNVEGWTLVDSADGKPTFVFPSTVIEPKATVRVYTNEVHDETGGFSFNSGVSIWNNSKGNADTAELIDQNSQTVSRMSYPPGC